MKPSQGLSWLALDGQRHLQTVTMNLVLGCEPSLMLNHSVLTTDPLRWGCEALLSLGPVEAKPACRPCSSPRLTWQQDSALCPTPKSKLSFTGT